MDYKIYNRLWSTEFTKEEFEKVDSPELMRSYFLQEKLAKAQKVSRFTR